MPAPVRSVSGVQIVSQRRQAPPARVAARETRWTKMISTRENSGEKSAHEGSKSMHGGNSVTSPPHLPAPLTQHTLTQSIGGTEALDSLRAELAALAGNTGGSKADMLMSDGKAELNSCVASPADAALTNAGRGTMANQQELIDSIKRQFELEGKEIEEVARKRREEDGVNARLMHAGLGEDGQAIQKAMQTGDGYASSPARLAARVSKLQAQNEHLQASMQQLKTEADTANEALAAARAKIDDLQQHQQLGDHGQQLVELVQCMAVERLQLIKAVEEAEEHAEESTRKHDASRQQADEQLLELNRQVFELREQLEQQRALNTNAGEVQRLQTDLAALSQAVTDRETETAKLRGELEATEINLQAAKNDKRMLKQQYVVQAEKWKTNEKEWQQMATAAKELAADYQKQLHTAKTEVAAVRHQFTQLEKSASDTDVQLQAAKKMNVEMGTMMSKMQQRTEELQERGLQKQLGQQAERSSQTRVRLRARRTQQATRDRERRTNVLQGTDRAAAEGIEDPQLAEVRCAREGKCVHYPHYQA